MNKVYKVVWCKATQTYRAVSEFARSSGKGGAGKSSSTSTVSSKRYSQPNFKLATLSMALTGILLGQSAYAVEVHANEDDLASGALNLGTNSFANATNSTAIGVNATTGAASANLSFDTAIGNQATATGGSSTAVGSLSKALGKSSTAFGNNATAKGTQALAIATGANAIGDRSIATGFKSNAIGEGSIASGWLSKAEGKNSIAIGKSAVADKESAVALGANSNTTVGATEESVSKEQSTVRVGAKTYTGFNGVVTKEGMQVSVGSDGAERQIKNVGAGKISADSTDAINGSQLWSAVNYAKEDVISTDGSVTIKKTSHTDGSNIFDLSLSIDDATMKWIDDGNGGKKLATKNAGGDKPITIDKDGDTGKIKVPTDDKKPATAKSVAEAINNAGWKVTAGADGGDVTGTTLEKVKAGDQVTFKAGKNMKLTQDGKNFSYATKDKVVFDDVQVGDVVINKDTGINAGNKAITGVKSNLPATTNKAGNKGTTAQPAPTNADAIKNNAATVEDILNAGFNLQNNGTAKDFVKAYDTVNFVNGTGTTARVTVTDNRLLSKRK